MSVSETSNWWARIQALAQQINQLKARVVALERRVAALEQQLKQRWGL